MRSFGSTERLGGDGRFKVPWVWDGSTDRVLVMEYVDGTSVGGDAVHRLPQADRDEVRFTPWHTFERTLRRRNEDSGARNRALPERALRFPRDANRSQLVQLPLEREDAPGEGDNFRFFLGEERKRSVLPGRLNWSILVRRVAIAMRSWTTGCVCSSPRRNKTARGVCVGASSSAISQVRKTTLVPIHLKFLFPLPHLTRCV